MLQHFHQARMELVYLCHHYLMSIIFVYIDIRPEIPFCIYRSYFDQFDKVLIDTPCSGEGRFLLSDSKSYSSWSEKLVRELINLQKKLLESAVKATKQGGIIVYSTCTLNLEENERIIDWAIKNLNVEVLDIDLKIKKSIKGNSKGLDKSIEKTIKIFPNEKMEGFYVAKLRKK